MEKKEAGIVFISILLMSLIIFFHEKSYYFLWMILISVIIVLFWIFCKKLTAKIIYLEIEHKFWEFQRWGLAKRNYFKKPVTGGVLIPVILSIISMGFITCCSFLQFETKTTPARAIKRYGIKRFSEIMEWDLCLIGFYGILGLLLISIISRIFAFPSAGFDLMLLSKYSLYYAIWNLLPISSLDGAKILFGSSRLYIFTLILTAIASLIVFI